MDGAEFKLALKRLGRTQSAFAREFGIPLRTVQDWARLGTPIYIERILAVLSATVIVPPAPDVKDAGVPARSDAKRAVSPLLSSMLEQGARVGWPRGLMLAATLEWLLEEISLNR
jgi:hypothetical protein